MVDGVFCSSSTLGELKCVVPHEKGVISLGSRGFIFKNTRGQQFACTYDRLGSYLDSQSKVKDIEKQIKTITFE